MNLILRLSGEGMSKLSWKEQTKLCGIVQLSGIEHSKVSGTGQ